MSDVQKAELDDARKGTLYYLSNIELVKQPSFDCGLISNFVSGTSIITDLQNTSTTIIRKFDAGRQFLDGFNSLIDPIKQLFTSFFNAVTERMVKLYGEGSDVVEWIGEFTSWAVSTFAGSLADVIPGWGYVQNAVDIYEGVKRSVLSCIKWVSQVYSGWGVELLAGGPAIMAQAIARHNATSLAGGLKDLALASIKTGLQAAGDATSGIGSIIGAVTGILQRLANLIGYCAQRFLMNKVIKQAQYQYKNTGIGHNNHDQFTDWFRKACITTPIVSALTITSGLTAHSYRFLALISKENEVIDQKSYDDGVSHIEKLKELGTNYLKEYQDAYKIEFRSGDPFVSGRLKDILK